MGGPLHRGVHSNGHTEQNGYGYGGGNGHALQEDNQSLPYTIHEAPGMANRPLRVVCIGAGLSGIYLGIKVPMALKNIDLCIYEKNDDVGGTWYENRYPGCACDVPAHRYCYTFEPNPRWSSFYAPSAEIQKYFSGVSQKYGASNYIKLEHKVVGASWDDEQHKWKLKVQGPNGTVFEDQCDVLINGMGVLNNWKWPQISGLNDFKGTLLHSANYDTDVDLTGKRVAVIGSGSSGIQIVPAIRADVEVVGAYLRSNTWIAPPFGAQYIKKDANGQLLLDYTEEEKRKFEEDPEAFMDYRRLLEKDVSHRFRLYMKDHPSQSAVRPVMEKYMRERLAKKPELAERLIPKWPVGCRRLTPGIGYLEALCEENVMPIFSDIASIDETGITTADGERKEYDAIICATGFDVSYAARFPFEGRNGTTLGPEFAENPISYMAMLTPGFPNYFTFNGPNAPVGAGSLVPATEAQGDYMVKAIQKIQQQSITSMEIKESAVKAFVDHTDAFMPRTVWSTGCRSWYKNGKVDGRVSALWPGSGLHFISALAEPRWEDYDYTYEDSKNIFAYLGDGFTELEWEGGDRTFDLPERSARFRNHPALQNGSKPKATKVFKGLDAANGVMGNGQTTI